MYQKVKGTIDYYGTETKKLQIVSKKVKDIIENFGYEEVVLPIIENTEVFTRSSGETSDIVRKEMYTFEDRGKRSLTLRPEGTAGVVRFFLESKEYAKEIIKDKISTLQPDDIDILLHSLNNILNIIKKF